MSSAMCSQGPGGARMSFQVPNHGVTILCLAEQAATLGTAGQPLLGAHVRQAGLAVCFGQIQQFWPMDWFSSLPLTSYLSS